MKLEKQAKTILIINDILLGIGIVGFVAAILNITYRATSFIPFIILFSWLFFIFIINYFVQSYGELLKITHLNYLSLNEIITKLNQIDRNTSEFQKIKQTVSEIALEKDVSDKETVCPPLLQKQED